MRENVFKEAPLTTPHFRKGSTTFTLALVVGINLSFPVLGRQLPVIIIFRHHFRRDLDFLILRVELLLHLLLREDRLLRRRLLLLLFVIQLLAVLLSSQALLFLDPSLVCFDLFAIVTQEFGLLVL